MGGAQHRRYRALVQPSFVPAKAQWWIAKWIDETVHGLIDTFVDDGRAELNVDFCAAIPVLTITGSFGIDVDQALDVREHLRDPADGRRDRRPDRRGPPRGTRRTTSSACSPRPRSPTRTATHRLSDDEIHSFAYLLLLGRVGHDLEADGHHAGRAAAAARRCSTRCAPIATLLKAAIEESVRWMPTDPMFSRWVAEDTELDGIEIPKGSVLHLCLGAANRDPERWERPDEFDLRRPLQAGVGLRRRSAHLPRHARRPGRDVRRHRRPARPAPEPPARPRRRAAASSSASTSGASPRSRWCSDERRLSTERRLLAARRRARPPLPGDRRRGRLRVERRADAAAHDDRAPERRAAHVRR